MNRSSKYQFYLPQSTDPISVSDFNYNFGLIDDNLITASQSWTSTEKSTARTNIGLGDSATKDVANNLTTTSSGSVLDARQGKALNDKIGKRELTKYNIGANSSVSITLDNDSRYLVITDSTATTVKDLLIVAVSVNGTVSVVRAINASNITVDTGTNSVLKLTNGATTSGQVFVEKLQ